jgi:predicted O-methyltransferase YrrM
MLSKESLALIREFARYSEGAVIEVGTYVGGTTLVLADALAHTSRRIICIEVGGAHDHPEIPSADIIGDWRRNLTLSGLPMPRMIEGNSWAAPVIERTEEAAQGDKAGLIVIDADGFPALTLIDFTRLLRAGCLVVIDDYQSEGCTKTQTTRRQVERAIELGELQELAVLPYGTWFGRLLRPLSVYPLGLIYASRQGNAFIERVPSTVTDWQLHGPEGRYTKAAAQEVIDQGNRRFHIANDQSGSWVYFAPTKRELVGHFELRA